MAQDQNRVVVSPDLTSRIAVVARVDESRAQLVVYLVGGAGYVMPPAMQPKLLRFLKTHRFMRVCSMKKLEVAPAGLGRPANTATTANALGNRGLAIEFVTILRSGKRDRDSGTHTLRRHDGRYPGSPD